MAFHPVPACAKLVMEYNSNGQICQNTYWVQSTAPWTDTTLEALVVAAEGWETATGSGLRGVGTALTKVIATDYATAGSFQVEDGPFIPGQSTSPPLPNSVTLSVKANTGLSGRDKRGRTYWIGMVEAFLNTASNNQAVNPAFITGVEAALAALGTAVATLTGAAHLVVAHRRHADAWLPAAVTYPILNWVCVDGFVDSQRRRLPLHNRHRR